MARQAGFNGEVTVNVEAEISELQTRNLAQEYLLMNVTAHLLSQPNTRECILSPLKDTTFLLQFYAGFGADMVMNVRYRSTVVLEELVGQIRGLGEDAAKLAVILRM